MPQDSTETLSVTASSYAEPGGSTTLHQSGLGRNQDPCRQDHPLDNSRSSLEPILQSDFQSRRQSIGGHPAVRPLGVKLRPRSPLQPLRVPSQLPSSSLKPELKETRIGSSVQDFQPRNGAMIESERLTTAISRHAMSNLSTGTEESPTENTHESNAELNVDYTVHYRPPVTHENIRPHEHVIIQPQRMRSFHFEEHKSFVQPIIDPAPTILPAQHWLMDPSTGALRKI